MSLLDLLKTVGNAKPGTRGIVCEEFEAVNLSEGGVLRLPIGTHFEVRSPCVQTISVVAELDGKLRPVGIFSYQYHMIALRDNSRV